MFKKRAKYIIDSWFNRYFRNGVLSKPTKELYCAAEYLYLDYMKEELKQSYYDKTHHHKICKEIRLSNPKELEPSLEYYSDRWYAGHRLYTIMEYCKKQENNCNGT